MKDFEVGDLVTDAANSWSVHEVIEVCEDRIFRSKVVYSMWDNKVADYVHDVRFSQNLFRHVTLEEYLEYLKVKEGIINE